MRPYILILLFFAHNSFAYFSCQGITANQEDHYQYDQLLTKENHPEETRSKNLSWMETRIRDKHPELLSTWSLLENDEKYAINFYTSHDYRAINQSLRMDDYEKHLTKIIMLCSALNKLPEYEGTVYRLRDMNPELFEKVRSEGVYFDPAFMSTSTNGKIGFVKNTLLKIKTFSGRSIQVFSSFFGEREVLIPPLTKFKVISIKENQIDPSHPRPHEQLKYEIELEQTPDSN